MVLLLSLPNKRPVKIKVMIVAKKGKEIINIKRVTPEREGLIREVLYAHTYNIPHIRIAEMLGLPKSTVVRWLNRYYVYSSKQGIPVLRVKIPTMTKPDCPHNCYICGKPIPAKRGDSSFCSRKCKAFYNSERKFDRSPGYYSILQAGGMI